MGIGARRHWEAVALWVGIPASLLALVAYAFTATEWGRDLLANDKVVAEPLKKGEGCGKTTLDNPGKDLAVRLDAQRPGAHCEWADEVSPVGSRKKIELLITYKNTSAKTQRDVIATLDLPWQLGLVPESTVIANGSNPDGLQLDHDAIANTGIPIGGYRPGSVAYVKVTVVAAGFQSLECGWSDVHPRVYVAPKGLDPWYAEATIRMFKDC
ncbi:hypothetical protein [Aeromicrobium sp. 9AM]|uniref:hypothetical protein n=1 Tax=Aeromicrobium sp. 9AM TaxID=2653126 RepID=UPI0012F21E5E|nr:hypothetical protein [Aeromicrobium sp. 9AM]VXB39022.1 hypothetical protein AERO9AM_11170 [Aeromicrobium sp. 9AM]